MTKNFDSQPGIAQSANLSSVEESNLLSEEITIFREVTALSGIQTPSITISKASPEIPATSSIIKSIVVSQPIYKSVASRRHYFMAEARKRSSYDFIMVARDPFHRLYCELPLSFEEDQEGGKRSFSLICEFPTIGDDQLVDFIQGDEDLLGMILISFHVHILNNLFLFCATRKADKLTIQATEGQFHGLGIYEQFIQYVDKIPMKSEMSMEITIPFHAGSLTECDEFMDDITRKFRKTLWQDQRANPAIRDYLKANMRLSIVT